MFIICTQPGSDKVFGEIVECLTELAEALEGLALTFVVDPFYAGDEIFEKFQIVEIEVGDYVAEEDDEGCEGT